MVLVTERARKHLKEVLLAKTSNPKVGVRLMRSGAGKLILRFDRERAHDQVVRHEDAKVLLIGEPESVAAGMLTIDLGRRGESPCLIIVER